MIFLANDDIYKIISPDRYNRMMLHAYYHNKISLWHGSDYLEYILRIHELEQKTGIIMSDSPSYLNYPESVKELKTVKVPPRHNVQILKTLEEAVQFAHQRSLIMSWKLDGQPLTLHYQNGKFQQAILSEPGSRVGYDVSHTAKQMKWVPIQIPCKEDITIYGTAVINWSNYNLLTYNNELELIHPSILARKSTRSCDGGTAKYFRLEFIAYHMHLQEHHENKTAILNSLDQLGFTAVSHWLLTKNIQVEQLKMLQQQFSAFDSQYPVSGLILEYNDVTYPQRQMDPVIAAIPWNYDVHSRENVLILRLLNDLSTLPNGTYI